MAAMAAGAAGFFVTNMAIMAACFLPQPILFFLASSSSACGAGRQAA